jgi:hypothetical protein
MCVKVIANSILHGSSYGTKAANEEFDVADDIGHQLLSQNMVRHAKPPKVQYETKVIVPEAPEVSAREPFRDGVVHHAKPETVDSEGLKVLSTSDIFASGTTDSRRRGRRSGSASE